MAYSGVSQAHCGSGAQGGVMGIDASGEQGGGGVADGRLGDGSPSPAGHSPPARRRLPRRLVMRRRPLLVVRRSRSGMRWKCRARHARAGDVGGALSRCATGRAALGLLVESGSTVTYYGKEGMSQAWGALKNACRCWPSAARCCRQRSAARAGTAARHAGRSAAFVRWRVVESKSEASLRLVGLGSFEMQVHGE